MNTVDKHDTMTQQWLLDLHLATYRQADGTDSNCAAVNVGGQVLHELSSLKVIRLKWNARRDHFVNNMKRLYILHRFETTFLSPCGIPTQGL
jgi:hypothetical protein